MTPDQVVERARAVLGHECTYHLSAGGYHPDGLPWNSQHECDCSGFAAWALGVSRWVKAGHPWHGSFPAEWIETTNLVRAAERGAGFSSVPWTAAQPGDLLVWGDSKRADGTGRQGHVGVVASVGADGPKTVIHCSSGNKPTAIQETSTDLFRKRGAIVARPTLLEAVG